jgi:hypothetical protein
MNIEQLKWEITAESDYISTLKSDIRYSRVNGNVAVLRYQLPLLRVAEENLNNLKNQLAKVGA